jgi:hypothetical protein
VSALKVSVLSGKKFEDAVTDSLLSVAEAENEATQAIELTARITARRMLTNFFEFFIWNSSYIFETECPPLHIGTILSQLYIKIN